MQTLAIADVSHNYIFVVDLGANLSGTDLHFPGWSKLWLSIAECQSLQDTVPNQDVGDWQSIYYLPSAAGAVVVVVVDS
jgi:hypothetical protein